MSARRRLLRLGPSVGPLGLGLALALSLALAAAARPGPAGAYHLPIKFHLVHGEYIGSPQSPEGLRVSANGMPYSQSADGSTVWMSGEGSFDPDFGLTDGGGHYKITNPAGELQAEGEWKVIGFVSWQRQSGGFPPGFRVEGPTPPEGTVPSAGIATVHVDLQNAGTGVLEVHCVFPTTPNHDALLEGVVLRLGDKTFDKPIVTEDQLAFEATVFYVPAHMPMPGAPAEMAHGAAEHILPAALPSTGGGPAPLAVWPVAAAALAALAGLLRRRR